MSEHERTPEANPKVVHKPQSKLKTFTRRATKTLDWTVLPIHEFKLLGKSIGKFKEIIKGIGVTFWSLITMDFKALSKSKNGDGLFKSLRNLSDKEMFVAQLSADDKEALLNLPRAFFFKRMASLLFCLLACVVGVYIIVLGATSNDVSWFRMVFMCVLVITVCFYTYVGLVRTENIMYSARLIKQQQKDYK